MTEKQIRDESRSARYEAVAPLPKSVREAIEAKAAKRK
jgi:hypothetical protein